MNILENCKKRLMHYGWDLAYGEFDTLSDLCHINAKSVNIIKNPYKHKWFADPFILAENDTMIYFLVEEFDDRIKKGRIAKISVEKHSNKITDYKIVLERDTHLSFPAIYRTNNSIYVHPENYKSGKSYIYTYDENKEQLINPVQLSENPLTDAVIEIEGDHYVIYATYGDDPNGCILHRLECNKFIGDYIEKDTIKYENQSARMAGSFIRINNRRIRPAQNCNGDYGKSVILYESQKCIGEILPWGHYTGLHTLNTLGRTYVIDLKKYDHSLFYKLIRKIKK